MNQLDKLEKKILEEKCITAINYLWFTKQYNKNIKSLHCFVEGKDDISFYRNFIDRYYSEYQHFYYYSNGVANVHSSFNELKTKSRNWTVYNKHRVLFFIDKDFNDFLETEEFLNKEEEENFFATNFYSIENYLVNEYIFERLLREIFQITDYSTIKNYLYEFSKSYQIFLKLIKPIMLLIIYNKKNNKTALKFTNKNLKAILEFKNFDISIKNDDFKKYLKEKLKFEIPDSSQKQIVKDLINNENNINTYIRGHCLTWFFIKIIKATSINFEKLNKEINNYNEKRKKINKTLRNYHKKNT